MKRSLKNTEKIMSSTAMTAPAMAFSIMTGRPIDRSKPWTAGKRFLVSSRKT